MQRKTKIITTVTATLALLALGSGTALQIHAANDVSSVSQTTAPTTATAAGTKLTANSASGTKQNYQVDYSASDSQSATYKKTTYGSTNTAAKQVDYVGGNTAGTTVKLNKQTTAVVQGTMGHTYVHWNKGDWSVTAVTSNADESGTPTQFAKQVNQQITKSSLPTSADTGAVTVYSQTDDDEANEVTWRDGKQVYNVTGTTADATVKVAQNADN
jgi:hypothetical protein